MSFVLDIIYEDSMTILPESVADKVFVFQHREGFPLLKWMHNDFMYVRFSGMRNTKTWSKSMMKYEVTRYG